MYRCKLRVNPCSLLSSFQLDGNWDSHLFLPVRTSKNWCITNKPHWRPRYSAPVKIRQCICTLHAKRFFPAPFEIAERNAGVCEGACRLRLDRGTVQERAAAPAGRCGLATGGHVYGQAGCPNSGAFASSEADDWIETIHCFPHLMMKTDSLYEMSQRLLMRRSIQIIAVIAPWGCSSYRKVLGSDSVCKYILGSELHPAPSIKEVPSWGVKGESSRDFFLSMFSSVSRWIGNSPVLKQRSMWFKHKNTI